MSLPSGTITFLFTDIEGSTKLWEQYPDEMKSALARHDALLRQTIEQNNGHVFKTIGDAFCAAFPTAPDALKAALATQCAFITEPWPTETPLRLRMALHTGEAEERANDYFGQSLNRIARLLSIGYGQQTLLSNTTCQLISSSLPEGCSLQDLGQHRLKDLQDPEHVFQLWHPDLPSEFPPLKSLDYLPTNLPRQVTSFIGREKEIEQVKRLLSSTPLLTLTGSGGCGKTRLALQVAADLLDDYQDSVWLVELASLSDASLVPQTTVMALGLREKVGRTLTETLTDYLQSKTLLLLLDNCEHLLLECARLAAALLRSCPNLKILATSREALNVDGEKLYRVPSLGLPDVSLERRSRVSLPSETATNLMQSDAVRLFMERAALHRSDFALTSINASSVVQVCHQLDGIPLALELAAAQVKVLTAEQIATRLNKRFRLLRGGDRTKPERYQTLRATMDWSYDLLSEVERVLLCRLSVFAGGWTLEAAESVCSDREQIENPDVLALLISLVDKSLVVFEEQEGEGRYRLLESVRQYGLERLAETGEGEVLRGRHRDFFLRLAEEAEPQLTGPEQAVWLERLETEHENLRSALGWCQVEEQGAVAGLRLAGTLWRFWEIRGYFSEGREWLSAVLGRKEAEGRTKERAKALNGAGNLARDQGDYAQACAFHEESLWIKRELGDQWGISISLNNLGLVAWNQGDYSHAYSLLGESLATFRELGDQWGISISLNNLGNVAHDQGDYTLARALHEESLSIEREIEDKQGIAMSLNNLGNVAKRQGDYAAARALDEESLSIYRELGDKGGIALSLVSLGLLLCKVGDYQQARACLVEGLALCRELGDKRNAAYDLEGFAVLASAQGQSERVTRLFASAAALREEIGAFLSPKEQQELEEERVKLREVLGEEAFEKAWAEGRAMTLEQAIEYALQEEER